MFVINAEIPLFVLLEVKMQRIDALHRALILGIPARRI